MSESLAAPLDARRPAPELRCAVTRIGVLALQGDFRKHIEMLSLLDGVCAFPVRSPDEIDTCDGLVLPGGESTTLGKLMARYGVDDAIRSGVGRGMAVFGTCAGMILLATDIEDSDQPRLGLMDITVRRNAFGRQVDSFEVDLAVPEAGDAPVRAVFIRAPYVTEVREPARALARLQTGEIVMVRQGNCLASAFHPELTDDTRIHRCFARMAAGASVCSESGAPT